MTTKNYFMLSSHIKTVLICFGLSTVFDACIFLTWFKQDYFFTGENNIMDIGLKAKN